MSRLLKDLQQLPVVKSVVTATTSEAVVFIDLQHGDEVVLLANDPETLAVLWRDFEFFAVPPDTLQILLNALDNGDVSSDADGAFAAGLKALPQG